MEHIYLLFSLNILLGEKQRLQGEAGQQKFRDPTIFHDSCCWPGSTGRPSDKQWGIWDPCEYSVSCQLIINCNILPCVM